MTIHIDTPLFLILSLFFICFLPYFHLIFIFLFMGVCEWFDKLFQKCGNLFLSIYEIITHMLENPIIVIGLIVYLRRYIIYLIE